MDKLVLLITLPNGLQKSTYDPNDASLVCAIIPLAAAGGALPLAIAQEETSLGEEEDIAGSIVSNV